MSNNIYQQFSYESIPQSIRTEPIFLLYKTVPKPNGKLDKVPYQPNGRKASSTDPETWCTFAEALDVYRSGNFTGIGLILVPPLFCIDLDNMRDKATGELHPIAQKITQDVRGWIEASVSGTGIHIFGFCDSDFQHTKHKWIDEHSEERGVEIYQAKRFIALTGNKLEGSAEDLDGLTEEVETVYNEYIGPHYENQNDVKAYRPTGAALDIGERLKLAYESKSGQKIRQLMAGDRTDYANDHSSADLALAKHLAFWLDNNPVLIEEAFGRSELANRDKWRDRVDYRERTIKEATTTTTEVYRPRKPVLTDGAVGISQSAVAPLSRTSINTNIETVFDMLVSTRLSNLVIPPIEYYDTFLVKNAITAVTGEASHGKSTFVLGRLHEIANCHENVMVVYCDADNPAAIAQERSERLRGKLDDRISYWGGFQTDADGGLVEPWAIGDPNWLLLIDRIKESGKEPIIVFDTLNSFMNGQNENDNAVVGKIMNHMRTMTNHGATVIIIHHTGKSESSKESRGASAFKGGIDVGWTLKSTIVDCSIQRMIVQPFKSRLGKTSTYAFEIDSNGQLKLLPSTPKEDLCLEFVIQHQGKSRNHIERLAANSPSGFSRQMLRDTINMNQMCSPKRLKTLNGKIYAADAEVPMADEKRSAVKKQSES